jgi:hypothetical protein
LFFKDCLYLQGYAADTLRRRKIYYSFAYSGLLAEPGRSINYVPDYKLKERTGKDNGIYRTKVKR